MALFQSTAVRELQVFIDAKSQEGIHCYLTPINVADFAREFIRAGDSAFILSQFDTNILNESYWEKATASLPAGKHITNKDGQIFRADYCPPGRLFKDGLGINGEIVAGSFVKLDSGSFLKVCKLYAGSSSPIEWLEVDGMGSDRETSLSLTTLSFKADSHKLLYSSKDNKTAKIVFRNRGDVLKLLESAFRTLVTGFTGSHVSRMNNKTLDSIFDISDKLGFSVNTAMDFINKDRTFEITLNLGKTGWGVHHELLHGNERLTLYYDRSSGIWALLT